MPKAGARFSLKGNLGTGTVHEHTSKRIEHPSPPHRLPGPSGPEKCRGQGAATQTVRQYGKALQRRHRHFLRPASPARFYAGSSGPEKRRGQDAATQTVRQYGKELQRRHRHFLRPASPARCSGVKNVEGKAQRRRQYASTARSCNAAIGIFSGPRLWPAF